MNSIPAETRTVYYLNALKFYQYSMSITVLKKSTISFYDHRNLNLVLIVKTAQLENLFFLSKNIAKRMLLSMGNDFQYYENRIAVIGDRFILQLD